jgi:hypothetical protein
MMFIHTLKVSFFGVMVGLEWSNYPEGYAGGSIAVVSAMPDRTKRDSLFLQVGEWALG